jgi:hypothetical protein
MVYGALISALEGLSLDLLAGEVRAKDVERAKRAMHLILTRVLAPTDATLPASPAAGATREGLSPLLRQNTPACRPRG